MQKKIEKVQKMCNASPKLSPMFEQQAWENIFDNNSYLWYRDDIDTEPDEIWCFPVMLKSFAPWRNPAELGMALTRSSAGQPAEMVGLCLAPTGQGPNEFCRIGLYAFSGSEGSDEETEESLKCWGGEDQVILIV